MQAVYEVLFLVHIAPILLLLHDILDHTNEVDTVHFLDLLEGLAKLLPGDLLLGYSGILGTSLFASVLHGLRGLQTAFLRNG